MDFPTGVDPRQFAIRELRKALAAIEAEAASPGGYVVAIERDGKFHRLTRSGEVSRESAKLIADTYNREQIAHGTHASVMRAAKIS
jgi:hypothetical protein